MLVSCSTCPSLSHFYFIGGINLELYFQLQVTYLCVCSKSGSPHFSSVFYCMHLEWSGWLYVVNLHFYLVTFFLFLKIDSLLHYITMEYNMLINHFQFLAIQLYRNIFVIFNIIDVAIQFLRSLRTYKDTLLLQHSI